MSGLVLRQLSAEQRAKAFVNAKGSQKQAEFLDTVREMEGGIAYAISTSGLTARAIHVNMNRAAKTLGMKLRWAPGPKDAAEVVVELADLDTEPRRMPAQLPRRAHPA